jgi:hypothetical protein
MKNVVTLKIYLKRDLAVGVYLSEAPSPPRFFLEWSSNFVGSESWQIQSVKLLKNIVSNRTQHPPPPLSHTLSVYTCSALIRAKFLSNPRRIHSGQKDEEKEECELLWAVICSKPPFSPPPPPPPPHIARLSHRLRPCYHD